jgi:hypothetical protein
MISLRSTLTTIVRLYCTEENYEQVVSFISHCLLNILQEVKH